MCSTARLTGPSFDDASRQAVVRAAYQAAETGRFVDVA